MFGLCSIVVVCVRLICTGKYAGSDTQNRVNKAHLGIMKDRTEYVLVRVFRFQDTKILSVKPNCHSARISFIRVRVLGVFRTVGRMDGRL